jgi:uncharacterized caspase-like protein
VRRSFLSWVVLALCLAVETSAVADTGDKRIALVIGNGAYRTIPSLKQPAGDAHAIAVVLRDIGFDVSEGTDLEHADMEHRVKEFRNKAVSARLALLFFTGRVLQVEGRIHLVPVDAKLNAAAELSTETIALDAIIDGLAQDGVRSLVAFIDASRDNPVAGGPPSRATHATNVAGTGENGQVLSFATAPGQSLVEIEGEHSPYVTALLKHIRTPGLALIQLLRRVMIDVASITNNKQMPWYTSSLRGEIYLVDMPTR